MHDLAIKKFGIIIKESGKLGYGNMYMYLHIVNVCTSCLATEAVVMVFRVGWNYMI